MMMQNGKKEEESFMIRAAQQNNFLPLLPWEKIKQCLLIFAFSLTANMSLKS
jgi:hypothetical protein